MISIQSAPDLHLVHQVDNHEHISDSEELERGLINQQLINKLHTNLLVAKINTLAHRFTARFWNQFDVGLNLFNTVFAAISGTSALSSSNSFIAGVFGLIVAVLTAINTFLKPNNTSNEHLQLAAKYGSLRDEIDLFLSQNCITEDENNNQYRLVEKKGDGLDQDIRQTLKKLISKFNELQGKTPMPFQRAITKAQRCVLR